MSNPKKYTFLALGDSYTIGEGVSAEENFPSQTVHLLNEEGFNFEQPLIIAKTGWTTDELQEEIANSRETLRTYDFVSLLIGVNNQYRGRNSDEYAKEFEVLLQQSIKFAGQNPSHVFVLSIPDWGVTPYANGRDQIEISHQISLFNIVNRDLSARYNVNYIEITTGSRAAADDLSLLANDGLHPSGKEYRRWAMMLGGAIQQLIK